MINAMTEDVPLDSHPGIIACTSNVMTVSLIEQNASLFPQSQKQKERQKS